VNKGVALDLFVCVVCVNHVGPKHDSEFLFQNLAVDIAKIQTIGGIILLGGDFNARISTLLDIIDTINLCELLHVSELVDTQQLGVIAKR
jgi:hypothetical protein